MALAETAILNTVVVEIQYRRGIVFFDRCGSVMLRLEELLGTPFTGSVPQMTHGELVNSAERMVIRYGPKAFSATQNWVQSPVRLQHIAPPAWDAVAETLEVNREVMRCGVRFIHMWKVDDLSEAEDRIAGTGLFSENEGWVTTFGRPKIREWTATSESREGTLRAALNAGETEIKGPVSADLRDVVPQYSVVLDLDYIHPGEAPFALHRGQVKDFMRSSWQRAKTAAASVHSLLAAV